MPSSDSLPARPVIRDPRVVPVAGTDAHLPPVPAHRLTPEWLRRRLAQAVGRPPAIGGDGARSDLFPDRAPTLASVLVPLVQRDDALHVLLTRRSEHLRDHAGQISFPGGRAEPDDADVVDTALRETEEEVGLHRELVEVIGRMPPYHTVTRYVVTPVVGLVSPDYSLRLDDFEVAEAFEVPLAYLMTPAHHRRHEFELGGANGASSCRCPGRARPDRPDEYFIWGATAAMLRNFYHLLSD